MENSAWIQSITSPPKLACPQPGPDTAPRIEETARGHRLDGLTVVRVRLLVVGLLLVADLGRGLHVLLLRVHVGVDGRDLVRQRHHVAFGLVVGQTRKRRLRVLRVTLRVIRVADLELRVTRQPSYKYR